MLDTTGIMKLQEKRGGCLNNTDETIKPHLPENFGNALSPSDQYPLIILLVDSTTPDATI